MDDLELALSQASEVANSTENEYCVINHDFRTITIPESMSILGVESDSDVHHIPFKMPRYFGPTDLSEFSLRINYMNAEGEGDIFPILESTVTDDEITFEWLVSYKACKYKGNIRFIVCSRIADTEGHISKEYNTAVHSLPVLEGLEIDTEPIYEQGYDVIETILQQVEAALDNVDDAIQNMEDVVVIDDTQPSSEYTKVWIKDETTEIEIPTKDEFDVLEGILEPPSGDGDYVLKVSVTNGSVSYFWDPVT